MPTRDHSRERTQTTRVLEYLREHPRSDVPSIREGIVRDGGPRIERIQRCIDDADRESYFIRREDDSRTGRTLYTLGDPRSEPRRKKACRVPYPHPLVAEQAAELRKHLIETAAAWVASRP